MKSEEIEKEIVNGTFNHFPTHDDDKSVYRKAYNRLITARNINESFGSVLTERYMEQFPQKDKQEMMVIAVLIKKKGQEEALREIQRLSAGE